MLEYLIAGGTVVDGTGAPARTADVGIRDGRVVAVGRVDEPAVETFDATGLLVTPGFVDPHTHYDAQLHWDGAATPSSEHGVTSVIGGNCGFTLAPIHVEDADYTRRMMAQVEGMPLAALEEGIDWSWETFGQFLDRLEGRIAVNAGFLVGHCALRRYVMGEASLERELDPAEFEADRRRPRPVPGGRGPGPVDHPVLDPPRPPGESGALPPGHRGRGARTVPVVGRHPGDDPRSHHRRLPAAFSDAEIELWPR